MNFNVKTISVFERQAKRLIKKYPSIKNEIKILINQLKNEPEKGIFIGNGCYKIRISIASKGRGKSGGARVITHFVIKEDSVYLLSVYDKSELENLSDSEIAALIKMIPWKFIYSDFHLSGNKLSSLWKKQYPSYLGIQFLSKFTPCKKIICIKGVFQPLF